MSKRKRTLLSIILLALIALSTTSAQAVFSSVPGDLHVDGLLNAADAAMMLRALDADTLSI